MKILCLGDTHDDLPSIKRAYAVAVRERCMAIVQVGDFGFWEHEVPRGGRYLDVISRWAMNSGIPFHWLDGNHENHDLLQERYIRGRHGVVVEMRPGLYHLTRGVRWDWDGFTFMALGGAASADKVWRLDQERRRRKKHQRTRWLWWPAELIRDWDAEEAMIGGEVDVMFCHDAPLSVKIPDLPSYRIFPEAQRNRELLEIVTRKVRPQLLVHGHYHVRASGEMNFPIGVDDHFGGNLKWHSVRTESLGRDDAMNPRDQWFVLDTKDLERR